MHALVGCGFGDNDVIGCVKMGWDVTTYMTVSSNIFFAFCMCTPRVIIFFSVFPVSMCMLLAVLARDELLLTCCICYFQIVVSGDVSILVRSVYVGRRLPRRLW